MNTYYLKKFRKIARRKIIIQYNYRHKYYIIVWALTKIPLYPLQAFNNLDDAQIGLNNERRNYIEMLYEIELDIFTDKCKRNKILAKL